MQNSSTKRIYNFQAGFHSVQSAECVNKGRKDFFFLFGSEVPNKKGRCWPTIHFLFKFLLSQAKFPFEIHHLASIEALRTSVFVPSAELFLLLSSHFLKGALCALYHDVTYVLSFMYTAILQPQQQLWPCNFLFILSAAEVAFRDL